MGHLRTKTWTPIKDDRVVVPAICPRWIRSIKVVLVIGDVFALPTAEIDYLFAVFASNGPVRFVLNGDPAAYYASVAKRSIGAAEKYERRVRAHFRKYKHVFTEGYSLPARPTSEMRAVYDSAARRERRPTNPCGTTLRSGFSGREFHWRAWPLNNVSFVR